MTDGIDKVAFVATGNKRNAELPMQALILHALQVNTNARRLPQAEDNGVSDLDTPLNRLSPVSGQGWTCSARPWAISAGEAAYLKLVM